MQDFVIDNLGTLMGTFMAFALVLLCSADPEESHESYVRNLKQIAGANPVLLKLLDNTPAELASKGQKDEFLASLIAAAKKEKVSSGIAAICLKAGITEPTGTERLIALQVLETRAQNAILRKLESRSDS